MEEHTGTPTRRIQCAEGRSRSLQLEQLQLEEYGSGYPREKDIENDGLPVILSLRNAASYEHNMKKDGLAEETRVEEEIVTLRKEFEVLQAEVVRERRLVEAALPPSYRERLQ